MNAKQAHRARRRVAQTSPVPTVHVTMLPVRDRLIQVGARLIAVVDELHAVALAVDDLAHGRHEQKSPNQS